MKIKTFSHFSLNKNALPIATFSLRPRFVSNLNFKMRCTNKKTIHCWAVVLAQLAEQSLVTLEAYGLNRNISKIYCTCIFNLLKGNN